MLTKILSVLSYLAFFLMPISWIGSLLYPLLVLLFRPPPVKLKYWATSTVLCVPTTLGLCCAGLIIPPLAVNGVKGSWVRFTDHGLTLDMY